MKQAKQPMTGAGEQAEAQAVRQAQLDGQVSTAILEFLAIQSQAVPFDRIVTGWLKQLQMRVEPETVRRVVERLVAQGLLDTDGAGRSRRYRLRSGSDRNL